MVINQRSRNGSVSLLLDFFLVLCVNLYPLENLALSLMSPLTTFVLELLSFCFSHPIKKISDLLFPNDGFLHLVIFKSTNS